MDLGRHKPPEGCVTYAFGNPTVWGSQAATFVASSQATVWGIAESHLDRDRLGKLEAKAMKGRAVHGSPARKLHKARHLAHDDRSNHGGTLLLPMTGLGAYTLAGHRGSQGLAPALGIGDQWCSIEATAMPMVLFMAAYLDDSVGLNDCNATRLMQMVAFAAARRKLLVAAADWNMTPQQLAWTGILTEANLSIVVPSDVDATCTTGRLLDYYVVSTPLLSAIRAAHTIPAPWGTHAALCLTLQMDLTAIEYSALRKPRRSTSYYAGHVSDELWKTATQDAQRQLGDEGTTTTPLICKECGISDFVANSPGAWELTGSLARWSFAMESVLIRVNGVPQYSQGKYRGRGQFARVITKTVANMRHKDTLSPEAIALEQLGKLKAQTGFLKAQVKNIGGPVGNRDSSAAYFLDINSSSLDEDVLGEEWAHNMASMCTNARNMTAKELEVMADSLKGGMQRLASGLMVEAKASFKAWLAGALLRGAKAAHSFTRGEAVPPSVEMTGERPDMVAATPKQVVQVKGQRLEELWTRRKDSYPLSMAQVQWLVSKARTQEPEWMTPGQLDQGLATGKNGAGLGVDMLETELMKKSPKAARIELLEMMHQIQQFVVWPLQLYLNIVALLAKASGGERAVGLMCQMYRLMGRSTRDCILSWRKERAGFWDNAVQGSSSLKAALLRVVKAEVRAAKGLFTGAFFSDFQSFYDNMDWVDIIDWAQEMQYPLGPLALGVQLHVAPRMVRVNGAVSDVIIPANGALAGCWQATEFARVLLYGILERLHDDFMPDQLGQVVDDVVFGTTCATSKEFVSNMTTMGEAFIKKVKRLRLPFSKGKAKIVCSSMADARAIESALKARKLEVFQAAPG